MSEELKELQVLMGVISFLSTHTVKVVNKLFGDLYILTPDERNQFLLNRMDTVVSLKDRYYTTVGSRENYIEDAILFNDDEIETSWIPLDTYISVPEEYYGLKLPFAFYYYG